MNEHRVPMLGAALRRRVDPARSRDPRVRELVAALGRLEVAPAPRPQFRAELRAQLVAVAPRLVAEGEQTAPPRTAPVKRPAPEPVPRRHRRIRLVKPLVAAACVLAAFALLLGGAVLLSRHALPGDALYGVKRAGEDTQYDLTGGNVARGKLKLEFAARRIAEVRALLPSGPASPSTRISSDTSSLVRDTLGSADGDVQAASRLLGTSSVQHDDPAPLRALTQWVPAQITALKAITASIPPGALRQRAAATSNVLMRANDRARALLHDLGCSCLGTTGPDVYGPTPCAGPCATSSPNQPAGHHVVPPVRHASQPAVRPQPHSPATGGRNSQPAATRPAVVPPAAGTTPSGTTTGSNPPAGASPTQSPSPSGPSKPSKPSMPALPTLPGTGSGGGNSGSTLLPINLSTCGLTAALGPIGISIGGC